jgi:hypothetical protein
VVAQNNFFLKEDVSRKIRFQFANNLIVIPIEINGVTLSFVLDTGVSKPILFNLSANDSLDLKNTKTFYLHGLGADGRLEALKSSNNKFKIGGAISNNQDLYVVLDINIDFTPRLGILVHGIIGYDIFKDFVVEINYNSKFIRLHKSKTFKAKTTKKWKTIPLDIYKKKPYIISTVVMDNVEESAKLLLDTGSSDALWLFENKNFKPNDSLFFRDYLGKGLSGSIHGKRSKIESFQLSDFVFKNVNVAFPDSTSIDLTRIYKGRNGSIGGEILKRFNLFFDYNNEELHLKRNSLYKYPFTYNNSGIILEHNGTMFVKEQMRLPTNKRIKNNIDAVQIDLSIGYRMQLKPVYKIVEIRKSSNAYAAGLRVGDILISINGKEVNNLTLAKINEVLFGKTGKNVKLKVERKGQTIFYKFKLDNVFKKNKSSI